MDPLDLALFRQLGLPFDGVLRTPADVRPASLARKVGTSAPTVRERMERLRDVGFLRGFALVPNPALWRQAFLCAYFELDPREKDARIRDALAVEGVLHVISFGGPTLVVTSFAADGADARVRLAAQAAALGAPASWWVLGNYQRPDPPAMTALDWRVFEALRADALRDLSDVAAEVGVTRRTVKTRLDRMLREDCVVLFPVIDHSRLPGALFHWLLLTLEEDAKPRALRDVPRALGERCLGFNPPADARHVFVSAWSRTAGEAEDLRLRAAALPGVLSAETLVLLAVLPGTNGPVAPSAPDDPRPAVG